MFISSDVPDPVSITTFEGATKILILPCWADAGEDKLININDIAVMAYFNIALLKTNFTGEKMLKFVKLISSTIEHHISILEKPVERVT
jgi:hypothetical protein